MKVCFGFRFVGVNVMNGGGIGGRSVFFVNVFLIIVGVCV